MPRKQKSIHYLYKTTCLITGRYYIGMHSTSNLEDGYMGSGKRLRYSIRKYGIENHIKEILEFFDSRELLIEAEKKVVSSDLIKDEMCLNLVEGGTGGYGAKFLTKEQLSKGGKIAGKIISERIKTNFEYRNQHKSNYLKMVNESKQLGKYKTNRFRKEKHSEETKKLMREQRRGQGNGESNSQYGTMWITNGTENRKIKKEDIIPEGWYKGRK